jgi:hypothetical protein
MVLAELANGAAIIARRRRCCAKRRRDWLKQGLPDPSLPNPKAFAANAGASIAPLLRSFAHHCG